MLAYDPASSPLNNNDWSFALVECFHIAAFAFSIGTIALVDLRLLGAGMMRQRPSDLLRATTLWTLAGLVVVISSGLLIFSSDPYRYFYNDSFRLKNIVLVIAVIYNYTIHRKVAMSDQTGAGAKLTALVSLLLWTTITFAGLFYAFT